MEEKEELEVIDGNSNTQSKSKKKSNNVIVIILILIVLGLVGYICYDKGVILSKSGTKEVESNTSKKDKTIKNNDASKSNISNEEAIAIGEKLYEAANSIFVNIGSTVEMTQPDQNGVSSVVCYLRDNNAFTKADCSEFYGTRYDQYVKLITKNITDVFTKEMFNVFLLDFNYIISEYNGEYYRIHADRGGNISYRGSDLSVVENNGDTIIFNLTSYYDNSQDPAKFDKSKAERKLSQPFIIKKEDGVWKVDRFVNIN